MGIGDGLRLSGFMGITEHTAGYGRKMIANDRK